MSKTIKIIDLLNKIANGELKRGTKIIYKNMTFLYDYPNLEGIFLAGCRRSKENNIYNYINTIDIMRSPVEIIEEQEEIDIQELEDVNLFDNGQNFNDMPIIIKSYDDNFTNINNTINKLVQAVKQLDKNIKEKQ